MKWETILSDIYGKDYVINIQNSLKWCSAEDTRVMAAHWGSKRQIRVGSEYNRSDVC